MSAPRRAHATRHPAHACSIHDPDSPPRALEIMRPMLDVLEARSGARHAILDGERGIPGVPDDVWVVLWSAADQVAAGDPRRLPIGAGPYLVAKDDAAVAMPSSTLPLDAALEPWRVERQRPRP